jgi:hypothetical protein
MSSVGDGPGDWAAPGSATPPPGWAVEQPPPAWAPPAPSPQGWQGPSWSATAAIRPGIIPLRPLSVGEVLDGAFTAMRRYPRVTLGLSAMVAAVQQLIGLAVDLTTGEIRSPTGTGFSALGTVSGLVTLLVNALLSAVLLGMLMIVIGDAVLGRPVTLATVWERLRPMFWRLLGAAFLATVLTYAGLLACVLGVVFTWVAFAFTTPALLLERLRVMQALRRSWRLAVPQFWRVLGIRSLAVLLAGVISSIISVPAIIVLFTAMSRSLDSGSAVHFGVAAEAVIRLSGLVAATLTAPFSAGVIALLYIDCRMRSEALDLALVRAAASEPSTA